jgi:hypothetical protein
MLAASLFLGLTPCNIYVLHAYYTLYLSSCFVENTASPLQKAFILVKLNLSSARVLRVMNTEYYVLQSLYDTFRLCIRSQVYTGSASESGDLATVFFCF